jgi:hypothetical protein
MQVTIEDLIADDEHALISDKVIHMGRLSDILSRGATAAVKDTNRYAHYLTVMGYERWGNGQRYMVDGTRGVIWVHRQRFTGSDPLEYLRKRITIMEDNFEI